MSAFDPLRTLGERATLRLVQPMIPLLALLCLAACATLPADSFGETEAQAAFEADVDQLYRDAGYRWHAADSGMSVQFGLPETDDRLLRIDCSEGDLLVMTPMTGGVVDEAPPATFWGADRRSGTIVELGDRTNLAVRLKRSDPLVKRLLRSPRISIAARNWTLSVANEGGQHLLRALVERCTGES